MAVHRAERTGQTVLAMGAARRLAAVAVLLLALWSAVGWALGWWA